MMSIVDQYWKVHLHLICKESALNFLHFNGVNDSGSSLVCNLFVFSAICFSARNITKMSALLKSFFDIEDIQVLQYKINADFAPREHHMSRSREDFYMWLFAGLQDTMLAVLSRVLSWCVSQSYRLLDLFFLSLKKKSYFYLHAPDELLWHVGWVSVLRRIIYSSTVCTLPSLYSITPYFMYE